jgi:hypothetical protein
MFTVGISRASHLLLICTGAPSFDDLLALADLAAALCRREGWLRVLIDCASLPPTFTADELLRIAAYAGIALADKHVALVVADEARFENPAAAAAAAGAALRLFTSHPAAADWLATVRGSLAVL